MRVASIENYSLALSTMTLAEADKDGTVAVRSLRQAEGINPLPTAGLLPAAGHRFSDAFLSRDEKTVLTIEKDQSKSNSAPRRLQLWDLTSGRKLWEPNGIEILPIRAADFHPSKQLMVTLGLDEQWDGSPLGPFVLTIRDLSTGQPVPRFLSPRANFEAVKFTRDGSQLVTVEATEKFLRRVRRWDAVTGAEITGRLRDFDPMTDGKFYELTRYGEFALLLNPRDSRYSEWRQFTIWNTDGKQGGATFNFVREGDAALAAAILRQASKVIMVTGNKVLAELDDGSSFSLSNRPDGAVLVNAQTGKQWIAPPGINPGFQRFEIQASRGLVLTGPSTYDGSLRIWEGTTGSPVSETMWPEGYVAAFGFTRTGDQVLTVTENGRVRLWYGGEPSASPRGWMRDMGEALSGKRIVNEFDVQRLNPEEHARLRRDTEELLKKAASHGDLDAQFVLRNSQP
jgi:WD40 repeat protein